jgi:hypothetical protein
MLYNRWMDFILYYSTYKNEGWKEKRGKDKKK